MRTITVTKGRNGYPQGLYEAIIDFANLKEAEEYASKHNGMVVTLHQRDGWQFWENCGRGGVRFEEFAEEHMNAVTYRMGEMAIFMQDTIEQCRYGMDEEEYESFVRIRIPMAEAMAKLGQGDVLCYFPDQGQWEVYTNVETGFSYDTHTYEVGVICQDYEE